MPDLTAVLLHEEEHRRRKDPLRRVFAALASWLFFFYPPVRWLLRKIYETTEMACDEAVLRAGISPRDYARSIARTLELGLGPAELSPAFLGSGKSTIRRRLARLSLQRSYRTMHLHRLILVIAAIITIMASFAPLMPGAGAGETPDVATADVPFGRLDKLGCADQQVTLEFNEVRLDKIFDALSRVADLEPRLDPDVKDKYVSVSLQGVTVREALIELSRIAGLHYEVPDSGTLVVRQTLLPGKDGVTTPVRIEESAVMPVYPEEARQAKIQGRVILQAVIDSFGNVGRIEVLRNSQPDYPSMAQAAIKALEQWRYEPATLDGKPVDVYFTVVIEFKLNGKKKPASDESGETL